MTETNTTPELARITETKEVRLYGTATFSEAKDTIRAALFGELVKMSREAGHVHFLGDLYHDAMWMAEFVTGRSWFYWAVDESGTQISGSYNYGIQHRTHQYRIELQLRDARPAERSAPGEMTGNWFAVIETLEAVG